MGFKQTVLVVPILICYLIVAICVELKRFFESVGQKLTDIAFN